MKVTKKMLDLAFNGAKWDVRADKTMVFLAEVDSQLYYEEQAKILIRLATQQREDHEEEYIETINNAIRHLILAKLMAESGAS